MMYKTEIVLKMSESEVLASLKSNDVQLITRMPFGLLFVNKAVWKNLDNPGHITLEPEQSGGMKPWVCKCSIKGTDDPNRTALAIRVLPPISLLAFGGMVLTLIVYAIIQFGIHNYGTVGFLPSILLPSFSVGIMFFIWYRIFLSHSKKLKASIISSLYIK